MEYFDELNENGEKTGRLVERAEAHEKGLLHAVSQIYIYRYCKGTLQILLQRRSPDKDSFPGKLDISAAGHVPAGMSWDEAAVKELSEELGLTISAEKMKKIGVFRTSKKAVFYGKPFNDEQLAAVYISQYDIDAENISFQKEEISEVFWMDAAELSERLKAKDAEFCINSERFFLVLREIKKDIPLLFSDENIAVCVKPASILAQSDSSGNEDALTLLSEKLKEKLYLVHRLDMNTGGIMVFAKNAETASKLSAIVSDKEKFKKEYFAVTEGEAPFEGALSDFIVKSGNKAYIEKRKRKGAKEARLTYKKLGDADTPRGRYSLLLIRLETGRFHQIRAQLASKKLPLVGDGKYGSKDNRCKTALFACTLEFYHPITGEFMSFHAAPPYEYPWKLFDKSLL